MKELESALEGMDFRDVATCIRSGNVVYSAPQESAPAVGDRIASALAVSHGPDPRVPVLTKEEFPAVLRTNPFQPADPGMLHVGFLREPLAKRISA